MQHFSFVIAKVLNFLLVSELDVEQNFVQFPFMLIYFNHFIFLSKMLSVEGHICKFVSAFLILRLDLKNDNCLL